MGHKVLSWCTVSMIAVTASSHRGKGEIKLAPLLMVSVTECRGSGCDKTYIYVHV